MAREDTDVLSENARRRWSYSVSQWAARTIIHVMCGLRYEGTHHVPLIGACLLAANHKSYLDPPAVGSGLRREIRYFAKRELFSIPIFGPMIRHFGSIPVDRDAFDRKQLAKALEVLRSDQALLVFPEGTRILREGFGDAKVGVGLLALSTGVPVVPVHIRSSYEPRRSLFRRIPIVVRFGPPIRFSEGESESRRERYQEITDQVMAAIAALEKESM